MDGILLFDKPIHWTSHDAVDFLRRRIGQRAVGHAGTLDPLATGLLILLAGKSTKLFERFSGFGKEYVGTMTLGVSTDTLDLEGRILREADSSAVTAPALEKLFSEFVGHRLQVPPAYSSVRKGGKKLYELARRGVEAVAEARPIEVKRFDLLRYAEPEAAFRLACSKGTYVRSICSEVGEKLDCGAALSSLSRTRIGDFSLADAWTAERLTKSSQAEVHAAFLNWAGE